MKTALAACITGLALCANAIAQSGEYVQCHYTYGGEEKTLRAYPVDTPYTVEPVAVGSYFLLRVVFLKTPKDVAGVHIYTYADREPAPVLIHQASFPYKVHHRPGSQPRIHAYGFTGQQAVYEPVRDGELQYWCAWGGGK